METECKRDKGTHFLLYFGPYKYVMIQSDPVYVLMMFAQTVSAFRSGTNDDRMWYLSVSICCVTSQKIVISIHLD
jgi:hypothetical protein